jgi:hypothetical protein
LNGLGSFGILITIIDAEMESCSVEWLADNTDKYEMKQPVEGRALFLLHK